MMESGYVYVLSNPSMPGILKIGRSISGGKQRASALYSTGVPTPFVLEFEVFVEDAAFIEKAAHESLTEVRLADTREFFKCEVAEAIEAIIDEYMATFDRGICNSDERFILDCVLMASGKTDHHFMTALHSLRNLKPEDIDNLVKRGDTKLRVVK